MIWRANVNVWECVGAVEEFGWGTQIRDGFPDEKRFWCRRVEGFTAGENRADEIYATGWRAEKVEGFGEEELGRERVFVETEFWGRVSEGALLIPVVSVPAAGCEAGWVGS